MRVFIYKNLHKGCWSVRALEGVNKGRVILHTDDITIKDCEFRVQPGGRERVLREGRKNVHAGVVGEWPAGEQNKHPTGVVNKHPAGVKEIYEVTYCPHKWDTFINKETEEPIREASVVRLANGRVFVLTKEGESDD